MTRYLLPLSLFLAACSGVEDPKTSNGTDPTITRPDSKPVDDYEVIPDSHLDELNTKMLRDGNSIKSNVQAPKFSSKKVAR